MCIVPWKKFRTSLTIRIESYSAKVNTTRRLPRNSHIATLLNWPAPCIGFNRTGLGCAIYHRAPIGQAMGMLAGRRFAFETQSQQASIERLITSDTKVVSARGCKYGRHISKRIFSASTNCFALFHVAGPLLLYRNPAAAFLDCYYVVSVTN